VTTPVRVDLLGSDDEMLSLLGMRAYTGDDAVGALLAAVAAAVDRPLQPVLPVRRRRRRIGFGVFATAAFLASGSGMAAAVSDGLPSVEDSIVALRSDRGDAPGAPAAGAEVQRQQGLESFARLGNQVGAVTVVDLVSAAATAPLLDNAPVGALSGNSAGMPSAAGLPAGSPTAVEWLRLPTTDPTLADHGAGSRAGGSAVIAGGGGVNPATGGSGNGAATGSSGTGSNPEIVSGAAGSGSGNATPGSAAPGAAAGNASPGSAAGNAAPGSAAGNASPGSAAGNASPGSAAGGAGGAADRAGGGSGAGGGAAGGSTGAGGSGLANRATAAPGATPSAPAGATGKAGSPR